MFQQRNQRRRFESSQNNFRRQSRKDPACVGEGIAAQIVDFDPPAFERGRHAACQRTVRCYQRDGFVLGFDCLAEANGDRKCFLFGIGSLDDACTGHRCVGGGGEVEGR